MTVFYTVSFHGKATFQAQYDLVLDALKQHQINLVSPELGNYLNVLTAHDLNKYPTAEERHYQAIHRNIERADAVVIEMSHQDFQIGFEAALTVERKKHLLALSTVEDFSQKITHPFFTASKYTPNTIDEVVREFLAKADAKKYSERFNFYLSKAQLDKLNTNSAKFNLNQSEYLRSLIENQS